LVATNPLLEMIETFAPATAKLTCESNSVAA
jgi:hypothetical protein